MKIILNGLLLNKRYSGVESSIENLALSLSRHRKETDETIEFLVPYEWKHSDIVSENFSTYRLHVKAHIRLLRIIFEQFILPALVIKRAADILHCPAYIASLLSPIPVVLSVYDCHVFTCPQFCRITNLLHYRLMLPFSLKKASIIIVPSRHTMNELTCLFPHTKDICRIIPLGISPLFKPIISVQGKQRILRTYSLPASPFILTVGRIDRRKNILTLLKAFKLLKKNKGDSFIHKLLIVGPKGDAYKELVSFIKNAGLEKEVFFTGFIPSADMPIIYSMADCFIFLSFHEGFGLPPLEAMSCGTPVIASNTTAVGEITKEAALQVTPDDLQKAAEAIETVLSQKTLRENLIARGFTLASKYTWEQNAQLTKQIYHEVKHIKR